jgi:hypothetical protein
MQVNLPEMFAARAGDNAFGGLATRPKSNSLSALRFGYALRSILP